MVTELKIDDVAEMAQALMSLQTILSLVKLPDVYEGAAYMDTLNTSESAYDRAFLRDFFALRGAFKVLKDLSSDMLDDVLELADDLKKEEE